MKHSVDSKVMRQVLAGFTLFASVTSLAAVRTGNGDAGLADRYSPEAIENIDLHLGLEYLQATPAEVAERNKRIDVALANHFGNPPTVHSALEAIALYGASVYEEGMSLPGFTSEGIENAFVYDIVCESAFECRRMHGNSVADSIAATERPLANSVVLPSPLTFTALSKEANPSSVYDLLREDANITSKYARIIGTSNVKPYFQSWSSNAIGTWRGNISKDYFFGPRLRKFYEFSSRLLPVSLVPQVAYFGLALQRSHLKALDAKIYFASGKLPNNAPYLVVYPPASSFFPVPKPVIFVGRNAKQDDIARMLATEAPKIYAYDRMFESQMLPLAETLDSYFRQFPQLDPYVARVQTCFNKVNKESARYEAYLTASYLVTSALAAPVGVVGGTALGAVAGAVVGTGAGLLSGNPITAVGGAVVGTLGGAVGGAGAGAVGMVVLANVPNRLAERALRTALENMATACEAN